MYAEIIMYIRFRTFDSKTLVKRGLFMKARYRSRIPLRSPRKVTASHKKVDLGQDFYPSLKLKFVNVLLDILVRKSRKVVSGQNE